MFVANQVRAYSSPLALPPYSVTQIQYFYKKGYTIFWWLDSLYPHATRWVFPYRTILGEPLGPENIGALGSIKEGHWVRKCRAIVSNCGL